MTESVLAHAKNVNVQVVGVGTVIEEPIRTSTAVVLHLGDPGPDALVIEGSKSELEFVLIDALAKLRAFKPDHDHTLELDERGDLHCTRCEYRFTVESADHIKLVRCEPALSAEMNLLQDRHVWQHKTVIPGQGGRFAPTWECAYCGNWDSQQPCQE